LKLHTSILTSLVATLAFLFVSVSPALAAGNTPPPTNFLSASTRESKPVLSWYPTSGPTGPADYYQVYIQKYNTSTSTWVLAYDGQSDDIDSTQLGCANFFMEECVFTGYMAASPPTLGAGDYRYWVRAWGSYWGGPYGEWSTTQTFSIAPTQAPTGFQPVQVDENGKPTITWSNDINATWYRIWIGNYDASGNLVSTVYGNQPSHGPAGNGWWDSGNGPDDFFLDDDQLGCSEYCTLGSSFQNFSLTLPPPTYRYRVYVQPYVPGQGEGPWSEMWEFTVNAPEVVSNFYPVTYGPNTYGDEYEDVYATLSWDGVENAESYNVVIRDSAENEIFNQNLTALELDCDEVASTCSLDTIEPVNSSDENFTLAVQSIGNNFFNNNDPDGWGINQFQVPEPPEPVGTFYQTSIVQGRMTLSWESVPGATHYSVFVFIPYIPGAQGCGIGNGGCAPYNDPVRLYSAAELGCDGGGECTLTNLQQRIYDGQPSFDLRSKTWGTVLGYKDIWDLGVYRYAVNTWLQYSENEYVTAYDWIVYPEEFRVRVPDTSIISTLVDYDLENWGVASVQLSFRDIYNQATSYNLSVHGTYTTIEEVVQHSSFCDSSGLCTFSLPTNGAPFPPGYHSLTICGEGPTGLEGSGVYSSTPCAQTELAVGPTTSSFNPPVITPVSGQSYSDVIIKWNGAPGADSYNLKLALCDASGCQEGNTSTYTASLICDIFSQCQINTQLEPGYYVIYLQSVTEGICNVNNCNYWKEAGFVVPTNSSGGTTVSGDRIANVLSIRYYPSGEPSSFHPNSLEFQYMNELNDSSDGYLGFNIMGVYNRFESAPHSESLFDNVDAILSQDNLCQVIAGQGIDQVWIWSPDLEKPFTYPLISSSYFTGSGGVSASVDACNNGTSFYLMTYAHGAPSVHNDFRHHSVSQKLSDVINRVLGADLWSRYTGMGEYIDTENCGAPGDPPNGILGSYNSATQVSNQCDDWESDFTGNHTLISCTAWGCDQEGYHLWWLANMPNSYEVKGYFGKAIPNWWDFLYDINYNLSHYWQNRNTFWVNESWFLSRGFN
jgi:hypothetical protein